MLRFLIATCLLAGCASTEGFRAATADLACDPADLSLAWSSTGWVALMQASSLEVAPGGALVMRRSEYYADVLRSRDGAALTQTPSAQLDETWSRAVEVDPESGTATVRSLPDGAVLRTIERPALEPGWFGS